MNGVKHTRLDQSGNNGLEMYRREIHLLLRLPRCVHHAFGSRIGDSMGEYLIISSASLIEDLVLCEAVEQPSTCDERGGVKALSL